MAPAGKRRSSNRARGKKATAGTSAPLPPNSGIASPVTPPLPNKRRISISSPGNKGSDDSRGFRKTRRVISAQQTGIGRVLSVSSAAGGAQPTSKVQPPPPSRRGLKTALRTEFSSGELSDVGRNGDVADIVKLRTAQTIPEETQSDDRDVCVVEREPLERNEFYRRYMSLSRDESEGPTNVARQVFSPVSPCNLPPSAGGRREEGRDGHVCEPGSDGSEDMIHVGNHRPSEEVAVRDLSVTRDLLSTFYCDLERKFISEIQGLHILISDKFRQFESLEGNIKQQLNEFRVVLSSGRNAACSQGRPTPLAKYEAKLDEATPHGDWVFDTETMCRILRVNLCMSIVGLTDGRGDTLDNISLSLRAILFGLLPSQKRAAYTRGVGLRHSHFRFTVVLNILYNVQQNVFNRFIQPDLSAEGESAEIVNVGNADEDGTRTVSIDSSVMKIRQPRWLEAGFIRKRHVEEARARLECNMGSLERNGEEPVATGTQKKSWIAVKETPDHDDIARYGALKVYRLVTTGLYQSREKARWVLFEELTYIMTAWEAEAVDVDQHTLTLKWGDDNLESTDTALATVPQCAIRKTCNSKADEENRFTLAQYLSSRLEMVLYICHDVRVRVPGNKLRQRPVFDVRTLRRAVNLIDVAAKFCVVFSEQSVGEFSHLPFLGAHPDSLKCIYAVALMLRGIVDVFMSECFVSGAFSMPKDGEFPSMEYHGTYLEYLLPAASVRKRLLSSRCLRLGADDFEKMNIRANGNVESTTVNLSAETDGDHIDVCEHGVMLL